MAVPIPSRATDLPRSDDWRSEVSITYPGKMDAETVLAHEPGDYIPDPESECRNRLYHDDNLPVLAHLARDRNVVGKVTLAYIDPPFATFGRFQSRQMNHAFNDELVGAEYVETLRHRLLFIYYLLADEGSLYLHLDARMVHYMRVVLDEIFGASSFRNTIARHKCNPKNYTRKTYGNITDYILFYAKTRDYTWNRPMNPWSPEAAAKEYPCLDEGGRRYKKVPIHAPGTRNGATGEEWRGMMPPPGKHWQYRPETLDAMDARGEIYWSPTGNPRRKVFLDQSKGRPVQDIWMDMRDAHNQNARITGYPTEKNSALLRRIVEASSNPGDLVLDCYSGSGTTLEAAAALGRRWIGVDNSEEAIRTTRRRLILGRQRMGDFVNVDEGRQAELPAVSSRGQDFGCYRPKGGSV